MILEQELLIDPCSSRWLRQQIEGLRLRDPVDALRDAEVLVALLRFRLRDHCAIEER